MKPETDITEKIRSAIKAKLGQIGAYVDDELPDYIMVMIANKKTIDQIREDLSLFLGNKTERFTDWLDKLLRKLQAVDGEEENKDDKKTADKKKPTKKDTKSDKHKHDEKKSSKKELEKKRECRKRRSDEISRSKERDKRSLSPSKPSTSYDAPIEDAIEIQQQDNAEFEEVVKSAVNNSKSPTKDAPLAKQIKQEPMSDTEVGKRSVTNERKLIKTSTGENVPIRKVRTDLVREQRQRHARRRYGAMTSVIASVNLRPDSETDTDDEYDYRSSVNVIRHRRHGPYRAEDKLVMRACREATSSVEADQARYQARRGDYLHWRCDDMYPRRHMRYMPHHMHAHRGYPVRPHHHTRSAWEARYEVGMRSDSEALRPAKAIAEKPVPRPPKMVAIATQTSPLPPAPKKRATSKAPKRAGSVKPTPKKVLKKKVKATPVKATPAKRPIKKVKPKPPPVERAKEQLQQETVKRLAAIVDDEPISQKDSDSESLRSYTSEERSRRSESEKERSPSPPPTKKSIYDYDERRTLDYAKLRQVPPKRRLSDEFPESNKGPPSPRHLPAMASSNVSRDLSDSDQSIEEVTDSRRVQYEEVYDTKYSKQARISPMDNDNDSNDAIIVHDEDRADSDTKFIVTLDGIPPPLPAIVKKEDRQSPQTVVQDDAPLTSTPLDNKRPSLGDPDDSNSEPQPVTPIPNPAAKIEDKIAKSLDELIADKQTNNTRCKFWPACKNSIDCPFVHPSVPCHMFPKCSFGNRCLYIHPNCRYDASCVNADCPYMHATRRDPVTLAAAKIIKSIPKQPFMQGIASQKPKQECKFYPNCFNTKCPFTHPAECRYGPDCRNRSNGCPFRHSDLDMPNVDRFKWCNSEKFVISPLDTSQP